MANSCSNKLIIRGPWSDLSNLIKASSDEVKDNPDYGLNFAGEKYDGLMVGNHEDYEDCDDEDFMTAEFEFVSKWLPPLKMLQRLSASYPSLIFDIRWDESGCDIWGRAVVRVGVVQKFVEWAEANPFEKCAGVVEKFIEWADSNPFPDK